MKYDEVEIHKDIEGNVTLNVYYEVEDIDILKEALGKMGVTKIDVVDNEESIRKQRPFTEGIPVVMKKHTKRINRESIEVIEELLCSDEMDDWEKTKKLCLLSGFDVDTLPEHQRPEGFISPMYSNVNKHYDKWKREENKTETPDNKRGLVREFAHSYIEEIRRKRQVRIPVGTVVLALNPFSNSGNKEKGTILAYNEDDSEPYDIQFADGSSGKYKRKEVEIDGTTNSS